MQWFDFEKWVYLGLSDLYNVLGGGSNFLIRIMIYFDLLIENPNL